MEQDGNREMHRSDNIRRRGPQVKGEQKVGVTQEVWNKDGLREGRNIIVERA